MGRRPSIKNMIVLSIRFDEEVFSKVQEIAELESQVYGKQISAHELIRSAVEWVYGDNERMREAFRLTRTKALMLRKNKFGNCN